MKMSLTPNGVLLTGATGLVGGALLGSLTDEYEVHAIVRKAPIGPSSIHWIEHDLSSSGLPDQMPAHVDTVVHLAQSLRFRDFPEAARDIFEVNVASTARLLEWGSRCGLRRFVYASSGGIYGHGDSDFREDDAVRSPTSLGYYLASKHSAELLVEAYGSQFIIIILRFFFVYGPEQRRSMLIPRLIHTVRAGKPISLQGSDGIRINPIYVGDAAASVKASLSLEDNARINVAGPEVLNMREIATVIGERVGREPTFSVNDADPAHLVGDISRMKAVLHVPEVSFSTGIGKMLENGDIL